MSIYLLKLGLVGFRLVGYKTPHVIALVQLENVLHLFGRVTTQRRPFLEALEFCCVIKNLAIFRLVEGKRR
jgi:hypothetical protein